MPIKYRWASFKGLISFKQMKMQIKMQIITTINEIINALSMIQLMFYFLFFLFLFLCMRCQKKNKKQKQKNKQTQKKTMSLDTIAKGLMLNTQRIFGTENTKERLYQVLIAKEKIYFHSLVLQ